MNKQWVVPFYGKVVNAGRVFTLLLALMVALGALGATSAAAEPLVNRQQSWWFVMGPAGAETDLIRHAGGPLVGVYLPDDFMLTHTWGEQFDVSVVPNTNGWLYQNTTSVLWFWRPTLAAKVSYVDRQYQSNYSFVDTGLATTVSTALTAQVSTAEVGLSSWWISDWGFTIGLDWYTLAIKLNRNLYSSPTTTPSAQGQTLIDGVLVEMADAISRPSGGVLWVGFSF